MWSRACLETGSNHSVLPPVGSTRSRVKGRVTEAYGNVICWNENFSGLPSLEKRSVG